MTVRIWIAHVTVVMPGPARCDDEITRVHGAALAVDSSESARAFHNKTQRALGVAVAGGHLARQDELQAGVQRLGDAGLAAQRRVFQDQHAAHGFFSGDNFTCAH